LLPLPEQRTQSCSNDTGKVTGYSLQSLFLESNNATPHSIRINYLLEFDPGGSIPHGLLTPLPKKGPYETFVNLAEQLKNNKRNIVSA